MALGQTFAADYSMAGGLDSNMVLGFSSWAPAWPLSLWDSMSWSYCMVPNRLEKQWMQLGVGGMEVTLSSEWLLIMLTQCAFTFAKIPPKTGLMGSVLH